MIHLHISSTCQNPKCGAYTSTTVICSNWIQVGENVTAYGRGCTVCGKSLQITAKVEELG